MRFPAHLQRYTEGTYAARNRIVADWVLATGPRRIVEAAGAVPQLAEYVLAEQMAKVLDYCWIEQDQWAIACAVEIMKGHPCFRAIDGDLDRHTFPSLSLCDVFVSHSLEHIDRDREVLARLVPDTHVFVTCPQFLDSGGNHKRYFLTELDIRDRYGDLLAFHEVREMPESRKFLVRAQRY